MKFVPHQPLKTPSKLHATETMSKNAI